MPVATTPSTDHDARLRRGRRWWDLAARTHYGLIDRLSTPIRDLALPHLDLHAGDSVLDIGCGTGAALPVLRAAVGPYGRVVGVDYSPRMIAAAQTRVTRHAWTNVEIHRADITRAPLGHGQFDAAVAISSLSATPDIRAAVHQAHAALRAGGRLFVFDMRLVPTGPRMTRIITRLARLVYRGLAGFTGDDVLAELRDVFATVEPVLPVAKTGGMITVVLATKAAQSESASPAT
jgi:ubiquinone/menaquinone biosynthesis C-methylase UbiE